MIPRDETGKRGAYDDLFLATHSRIKSMVTYYRNQYAWAHLKPWEQSCQLMIHDFFRLFLPNTTPLRKNITVGDERTASNWDRRKFTNLLRKDPVTQSCCELLQATINRN